VHNAATGYWSIGTHSSAPSTALCAYDASFAAGLLEAACQASTEARRVLLLAADLPYPVPLAVHRPVRHGLAAALVLEKNSQLEISVRDGEVSPLPAGLESFAGNAAAACLPLLAALARPGAALARARRWCACPCPTACCRSEKAREAPGEGDARARAARGPHVPAR
jgi:hypothetical protein